MKEQNWEERFEKEFPLIFEPFGDASGELGKEITEDIKFFISQEIKQKEQRVREEVVEIVKEMEKNNKYMVSDDLKQIFDFHQQKEPFTANQSFIETVRDFIHNEKIDSYNQSIQDITNNLKQ